jgi:5-hydroxyisourate hydrolase-like protein (transthyretin family)
MNTAMKMFAVAMMTGGFAVSSLVGCSGSEDASKTPATATAATTDQAALHGERGNPERFLQKFDANKDGKVQLTELPERMQKWLGKADTNADGVISPDEMKAHGETMRAEHFAKGDKNSDGAIDASEAGDRWEHLKVADADGNGSVTRAEIDKAIADGKMHPMGGHDRGPRGRGDDADGERRERPSPEAFFQKLDKDGNGTIDASEIPDRMKDHVAEIDTNKDGKISLDELKAAKPPRPQHAEPAAK